MLVQCTTQRQAIGPRIVSEPSSWRQSRLWIREQGGSPRIQSKHVAGPHLALIAMFVGFIREFASRLYAVGRPFTGRLVVAHLCHAGFRARRHRIGESPAA